MRLPFQRLWKELACGSQIGAVQGIAKSQYQAQTAQTDPDESQCTPGRIPGKDTQQDTQHAKGQAANRQEPGAYVNDADA